MTSFIQNILWNSVSGFVEAGTRTAGGYAGDALIKAGDLIENSGRSMGTSIERRASTYGSSISGQTYQPSAKALPSTARKPVAKRSNSSPASTKAGSKTPVGANKYPGGKQIGSAAGTAKKQVLSGVTGAKSITSNPIGGAQKALGSTSSAAKTAPKALPKPYPNNTPYPKAPSSISSAKGVVESKASSLPKPYPSGNAFPSSTKKTAVKPGQPKPFRVEEKDEKKLAPYPGTNTLPGQGGKSPVKPKKYKPMERMAPPAERGKVQHIAI